MKEAQLFIICGPSGVGKKTLLSQLIKNKNLNLTINISYTSRKPRLGEIDGKDYHFISKEKFKELIQQEAFLEFAYFFGEYYGTLKSDVKNILTSGKNLILEIEVIGFNQIKNKLKNFVSIFIYPPSENSLRVRLESRKTETEEQIQKRLLKAKSELSQINDFKYKVLNNNSDEALIELTTIISHELNLN